MAAWMPFFNHNPGLLLSSEENLENDATLLS